jgi:5-bromo-4-chloroindolyl phosphate hydrolysis protein
VKKLFILLDFDGVLFNSAYEAYLVCEEMAKKDKRLRRELSFDEFMIFRSQLTDAWQFSRLYDKGRILKNVDKLRDIEADKIDLEFSDYFFSTRKEMMKDLDWPKLMSPYSFFYQLKPIMNKLSENFKILSTRNYESINRTLNYYGINNIEISGQESIREHGSKLEVARNKSWLRSDNYTIYIDDMSSHLEPFENEVDLCLQAEWGYDDSKVDSFSQNQAFKIINGFITLTNGKVKV